MKMTVGNLLKALADVPPEIPVVFQANVAGEADEPGEEPGYTVSLGYVYSGFTRTADGLVEFVIDGAITDSET